MEQAAGRGQRHTFSGNSNALHTVSRRCEHRARSAARNGAGLHAIEMDLYSTISNLLLKSLERYTVCDQRHTD
jgi:hypothetical protein